MDNRKSCEPDHPEESIHVNEIAAPIPTYNPSDGPVYPRQAVEARNDHEKFRKKSQKIAMSQKDIFTINISSRDGDVSKTPPPSRTSIEGVEQQKMISNNANAVQDSGLPEVSYDIPDEFSDLNEALSSPLPVENPNEAAIFRHHSLEEQVERIRSRSVPRQEHDERQGEKQPVWGLNTRSEKKISKLVTEFYTVSYLIFFAQMGTLARLGLSSLTTYAGAPVTFGTLWANFAGTMVLGFLAELSPRINGQLPSKSEGHSAEESGGTPVVESSSGTDEDLNRGENAADIIPPPTRPIPLYIGLATGFCGSFTSFSSFILEIFMALSNSLPAPSYHQNDSSAALTERESGMSVMALLAVTLLTVGMCFFALKIGAHIATPIDRLNLRLRRYLYWIDKCSVVLALGGWIGAILLTILPPDQPTGSSSHGNRDQETWRGEVLFAIVFAPFGCLLRFYISIKLNTTFSAFPLGTFVVNLLGTAILGMAWDLQHAPCKVTNGSRVAIQVLQGVMDGFCGCLTTVSTWMTELNGLRRRHSYFYGSMSIVIALVTLIVIIGTMKWTIGWHDCT